MSEWAENPHKVDPVKYHAFAEGCEKQDPISRRLQHEANRKWLNQPCDEPSPRLSNEHYFGKGSRRHCAMCWQAFVEGKYDA